MSHSPYSSTPTHQEKRDSGAESGHLCSLAVTALVNRSALFPGSHAHVDLLLFGDVTEAAPLVGLSGPREGQLCAFYPLTMISHSGGEGRRGFHLTALVFGSH